MSYFTIGHRLPHFFAVPLFGDRARWGLEINHDDPMWHEWEKTYLKFYTATQKASIGNRVNHAGYNIMCDAALGGKRVLEIGPGDIRHLPYWQAKPGEYVIADIQQSMLDRSGAVLLEYDIPHKAVLLQRDNECLPFEDGEFDAVVSFYALEHITPLNAILAEIKRVLRHKGVLIGAIPTEGGLAWGGGRFLTSRRWLKTNTSIDPNKLICWEHPNFAEQILQELDRHFVRQTQRFWPFGLPFIDLNLVVQFIYSTR
jgi:ubiquinone/menaquinone biosynthesis C-methylase UbiE